MKREEYLAIMSAVAKLMEGERAKAAATEAALTARISSLEDEGRKLHAVITQQLGHTVKAAVRISQGDLRAFSEGLPAALGKSLNPRLKHINERLDALAAAVVTLETEVGASAPSAAPAAPSPISEGIAS